MSGRKATKNIKKEENINTLRDCLPYLLTQFNECVSKLPADVRTIQSNDENLRALFKTMWIINMMVKSVLGDDAVTRIERIQFGESSIDLKSSLKEVYKTMRKLNSLLSSKFHSDT